MDKTILTKRELQVLKHLVNGMTNAEIAKKMNISDHTVKAYISSIIDKFKVKSRLQVAVTALRNNIVK